MGTARGRALIDLPIEACWQKLRDLERARYYVPGVTAAELTTERREGVGASRRVQAALGPMDETVIAWDEGRGLTLRLHRGDRAMPPFSKASFRYALEPAGAQCEIHTRMDYALRGGPFGRLLDTLVLGRVMAGNVRDVTVCLARHYETDAPVPPDQLAELRRRALPPEGEDG